MAIAFFGTATQQTAATTTVTISGFSVSTSNGLLIVTANTNQAAYNFTGITCSDGAMTEITHVDQGSGNNISLWYFVGPTTASQTITATASGAGVLTINATSYSGVKQSGFPDASGTNTAASGSTYSQSLTTIADNCWIVWGVFNGNITGGAVTAGTNTTVRQNSSDGSSLSDTNALQTPAGSKTMNLTKTGSDKWCSVMASFAPAAGASAKYGTARTLLGVGT